jgi:hypothetical protein
MITEFYIVQDMVENLKDQVELFNSLTEGFDGDSDTRSEIVELVDCFNTEALEYIHPHQAEAIVTEANQWLVANGFDTLIDGATPTWECEAIRLARSAQ